MVFLDFVSCFLQLAGSGQDGGRVLLLAEATEFAFQLSMVPGLIDTETSFVS